MLRPASGGAERLRGPSGPARRRGPPQGPRGEDKMETRLPVCSMRTLNHRAG